VLLTARCVNSRRSTAHPNMRMQGKITDWNDPRGFGFVIPLERGERVFVHVSAFPSGSRRPTDGEFVSYTLGTDERGRRCATLVTYVVSRPKRPAVQTRSRNLAQIAGCVAAVFLGVVTLLAMVGRLWWPAACVYIVTSIATFFAYKHDKEAALAGASRTNEWALITLGLIGGWPGALVARHRFRHKTRKIVFRVAYWFSVGLNVSGLAWLIAQ
jgi:uncharacterized membrane protein YsdA (DUF1294 family)/cold shock CspA family protein